MSNTRKPKTRTPVIINIEDLEAIVKKSVDKAMIPVRDSMAGVQDDINTAVSAMEKLGKKVDLNTEKLRADTNSMDNLSTKITVFEGYIAWLQDCLKIQLDSGIDISKITKESKNRIIERIIWVLTTILLMIFCTLLGFGVIPGT